MENKNYDTLSILLGNGETFYLTYSSWNGLIIQNPNYSREKIIISNHPFIENKIELNKEVYQIDENKINEIRDFCKKNKERLITITVNESLEDYSGGHNIFCIKIDRVILDINFSNIHNPEDSKFMSEFLDNVMNIIKRK